MKDEQEGWDPLDHTGLRRRIEEGTLEEWSRVFPATYGGIRLEAENLRFAGKDNYSLKDQKKAWMENRELSRPLKANLILKDATTGDELDRKENITLMRVPYYTDRGTFVYNGNNFTATSQSRLIPGAYTRRQTNGGLETQFNSRSGTGRVFRVALEPESGQLRMRIAGSDFHLYSMLKALGISDDELSEAWGDEVTAMNRQKVDPRVLDRAYAKFVPKYAQTAQSNDEKARLVIDALNKAQVAKTVVDRTLAAYWKPRNPEKVAGSEFKSILYSLLPKAEKQAAAFDLRSQMGEIDDEGDEYQPVGVEGVLAASKKLLAVNRGMDEPDERNIPAFSKIYPMDKLMRERIRLDEGKLRRNMLRMIASRRNLSPLHPRVFDPYYKEIITKNPLTTPIEETNPLQLVGQQRRVTQMGPGGIGSSDAITPDMQAVQPGEFGFYSPLEGPECFAPHMEVMTERGWIYWDQVTDDDKFLTSDEGYQRASRIIRTHYVGDLIVMENASIYCSITPTHRVVLLDGSVQFAAELYELGILVPTEWEESIRVDATDWSRSSYRGPVYCATVPGGKILVRGRTSDAGFWSGNSERAGVDVRMAWGVRIGKDGRMRRRVRNLQTGEVEWKSPAELFDHFVRLPD